MDTTPTGFIVDALTRAIVEHRMKPGSKLVEQRLAEQFGVSRTLIRQALFKLSQNRLIRMEPSRGAFVAAPSGEEARQVFGVRRLLEAGMAHEFVQRASLQDLEVLQAHIQQEKIAIDANDVAQRTALLGDFHIRMARIIGNHVLAELLGELIARCALIVLLYQTSDSASQSHEEHRSIVEALSARDAPLAAQRIEAHLRHVEDSLKLAAAP
jgi:DNA-binding GntR family transcriptional regulator